MTIGISRRAALAAGAGAVAVGAVALTAQPAAASPSRAAGSETAGPAPSGPQAPGVPVRSDFAGREGTVYTGTSRWSTHELVLQSVHDLLEPGGDPEHRFGLYFTTDVGARDGIYRLSTPGAPEAILFLARVGGAEPTLEAIVDRVR